MAFNYEIKIYEKNVITDIKPNVLTETIKLDESLDSALIVIPRTKRKKPFSRFTRLNAKVFDNTTLKRNVDYLVYATDVQLTGKGTTIYYEHNLGLIEPIKWFEKFQCGTLTFTQPLDVAERKSLLDYVQRLMSLVPFVSNDKVNATRLFTLDSVLSQKLEEVKPAPQIYLEQKNLRQALIEIFKVINAIPRIVYNESTSKWVLTADYVNQKRFNINIEEKIIDYKSENDGDNLGQSADFFQENAIPNNEHDTPNVYANSVTEYLSFRSDDIIVGESNQKLILDYPINELKAIYISHPDGEYDITSYCVEKKVYDTYDFDNGVGTRSHAFYWNYKSNVIDGLSDSFNALYVQPALKNIINDLGLSFSSNYEYGFRVEFTPYIEDMRSIIYRVDRKPYEITENMFDQYSTVKLNQQERLNDLFNSTKNVYGEIQRIGVDTVSISKKHYKLDAYNPTTAPNGIYSIGDYSDDGFVVTKVEIIYYRAFVIARYEMTKNWNRIAQFINIDKEFRPYEIALTGRDIALKRDIVINAGFVELSTNSKGSVPSRLTSINQGFMKTFLLSPSTVPFKMVSIITGNETNFNSTELLNGMANVKQLQLLAERNIIKYRLDFNDTKLAGKKRIDDFLESDLPISIADYFSNLNHQVESNYTLANGEVNHLQFVLIEDLWEELDLKTPNNVATEIQKRKIKYYMSLMTPSVYNKKIINSSSGTLNEQTYQYIWFYDVVNNRVYIDLCKVFDDYDSLVAGEESGVIFYYDSYHGNIYQFLGGTPYISTYNFAYIEKDVGFASKVHYIGKDRSEVLGLDIQIPLLTDVNLTENIIIGDYLVKNNALLRNYDLNKTLLKWCILDKVPNKSKTDKITENDLASLTTYGLTSADVATSYINVNPAVYAYDYFALVDDDFNLYIIVNQRNDDGTKTDIQRIYFNFLEDIKDL